MWFDCQKYLLLEDQADFNQTFFEELLTHGSNSLFMKKRSKVIKGVISGLKAKNCEKYLENHWLYKLHSRVTSLAHKGSFGCQPFGGQRSLTGHFWSKTKKNLKCSRIFISKCKNNRVTWLSHMHYCYTMFAWYFYFGGQRSLRGHFRFGAKKLQEFLFPQLCTVDFLI